MEHAIAADVYIRQPQVHGLTATTSQPTASFRGPAKKSAAWRSPNYQALVRDGVHPTRARLLKYFYDSLPAGPQARFSGVERSFVESMACLQAAASTWIARDPKTPVRLCHESFMTVFRDIYGIAYGLPAHNDPCYFTRRHVRDPHGDQLFAFLGDNSPFKRIPKQARILRVQREIDLGWPVPRPAWERKGIYVVHRSAVIVESRGMHTGARWTNSPCTDHGYIQHFCDASDASSWVAALAPFLVISAKKGTRLLASFDTMDEAHVFAKNAPAAS